MTECALKLFFNKQNIGNFKFMWEMNILCWWEINRMVGVRAFSPLIQIYFGIATGSVHCLFVCLWNCQEGPMLLYFVLKEVQSDFFNLFSNFWRFCYHKKANFSHNPCQISQLKCDHLKDINENVLGYGNHNQAYT